MNTNRCVTVARRQVPGRWVYVGARVYVALARKDGRVTWEPVGDTGPARRSPRLAEQDARVAAAELGIPFVAGVRRGQEVVSR